MRYTPHAKPKPLLIAGNQPRSVTAPRPPTFTGFPTTLTLNEHNRLELRFPERPNDATRDGLERAGWHWNDYRSCWTIINTADHQAYARKFLMPLPTGTGVPVAFAETQFTPRIITLTTHETHPAP